MPYEHYKYAFRLLLYHCGSNCVVWFWRLTVPDLLCDMPRVETTALVVLCGGTTLLWRWIWVGYTSIEIIAFRTGGA